MREGTLQVSWATDHCLGPTAGQGDTWGFPPPRQGSLEVTSVAHRFSSWAPTPAPWHKHLLLPFTKHLPSEPALQWEHRRNGKRLTASCLLQALEIKCAKLALQLRSNASAYPSHVLGLPSGEQPPARGQETQTFGCTSHTHTQNSDLASGL